MGVMNVNPLVISHKDFALVLDGAVVQACRNCVRMTSAIVRPDLLRHRYIGTAIARDAARGRRCVFDGRVAQHLQEGRRVDESSRCALIPDAEDIRSLRRATADSAGPSRLQNSKAAARAAA